MHGVRFIHVAESLVLLRQTRGSVSSDVSKMAATCLMLYQELVQILESNRELSDQRRESIAFACAANATVLWRSGKHKDSIDAMRLSRSLSKDAWRDNYPGFGASRLIDIFGYCYGNRFISVYYKLASVFRRFVKRPLHRAS